MIQAIVFDWGGIFTEGTFDSDAVRNLSLMLGVPEERIAGTYYSLMARFEAGAFDLPGFIERFREDSGLEFDEEEFRLTFLGSGRERDEMYRFLATIPQRFRVGMLSNNVAVLCDQVRDDPRMVRIERFVFSNEIGCRKPDPEAFAAVLEAVGVRAENTVFIDDSAANIEASRRLGFHGVHLRDFDGFMADLGRLVPELAASASRD